MKSGGFVECKYHHIPWGGRSHRERTENAMFWILAESPYFPGNERENRRYLLNEMFHRTREYCGNKDYIIQSIVYGKCPNRPRGYKSPFGYVDLGQNAQCMKKGQYISQRQVENKGFAVEEPPPPPNNPANEGEPLAPNSPAQEGKQPAPNNPAQEEVKVIRIGNEQPNDQEQSPEQPDNEIPFEPVEPQEPVEQAQEQAQEPISPYEPIGFRTRSRRTKRTRSGRAYGDYFGSSMRAPPDPLPVPSMFTSPQPGMQSTLVTLNIPDDATGCSDTENSDKDGENKEDGNGHNSSDKDNTPNDRDDDEKEDTRPPLPPPPPAGGMNLLWDKPMLHPSPQDMESEWEKIVRGFHQRISYYKSFLNRECNRDAECLCRESIYRKTMDCLDEVVHQWNQYMDREKQVMMRDHHITGISWSMKLEQLKQSMETTWIPRLYRCVHDALQYIRRCVVEDRKKRLGHVRRIQPPMTSSERRVIMYKIQNLEHESYLRTHSSPPTPFSSPVSQLVQMRNREIFQNAKRRLKEGLRRYGFEWAREQLQPVDPQRMDEDIRDLVRYWKNVSGSSSTLTPKQWRLFLKTCFPGDSASVDFIKNRFGFSQMVWTEAMNMYRRVVDPRTSLCLKVWARKIQNKY